ncbi:MAG: cupin domain-containing protein [Thermomicrobiales bacterium]
MAEDTSSTTSNLPGPESGPLGGPQQGPRDVMRQRQNPDLLIPPRTDSGTMPNLRFSFADSHVRLQPGGWTNEVTQRELPIATEISGVQMHLNGGDTMTGVRELHWHKEAEWAYMLSGTARITAVDPFGGSFVDDVKAGDLWFFPAGVPHSIQAHREGCEFLLTFDDGAFSENGTLLLSDFMRHVPPEVLAKNFGQTESAFANIPQEDLYIFWAPPPPPLQEALVPNTDPNVQPPQYSFHLSQVDYVECPGGRVKIIDSRRFGVTTISCAVVEADPGAMRELHWHPNADEWQYYLEGSARMTVFDSSSLARTFDYQAGDVGYVPKVLGHYVENTGDGPMRFLALFRHPLYQDVSLSQWLALTPPGLVKAHLSVSNEVIASFSKTKQSVVGGTKP